MLPSHRQAEWLPRLSALMREAATIFAESATVSA
jgi:hypothetical protein